MRACNRILAGLVLLLSVVALLLSLAGAVGVWLVKGRVTARATRVFERVESALAVADHGFEHVKSSLARAVERLDSAREEQTKIAQQPQSNNAMRRMLARTVQQKIAPELGNANEKLHTVAEAAVVVNSVLEDAGNFPFLATSGLDIEGLTRINTRLSEVAPAVWDLSRLIGEPRSDPDPDEAAQMSRVDQTLKTMQGLLSDYESQVTQVRHRVEALKARTLPWILPASILISLACIWIALSQVSLLIHAWSWWKRSGNNTGER
jgi:hypothetical protein